MLPGQSWVRVVAQRVAGDDIDRESALHASAITPLAAARLFAVR